MIAYSYNTFVWHYGLWKGDDLKTKLSPFLFEEIMEISVLLEKPSRAREAMKHEDATLLIPGKVKTFKPTGKKILESLEGIMVMSTDNPNRRAFGIRFKVPRVI